MSTNDQARRIEALEDALLKLVNCAAPAGTDSTGHDMVKLRRALWERAVTALAFDVCDHCGKRDRTVQQDRFDNVLCKSCAEAESAAEDRESEPHRGGKDGE